MKYVLAFTLFILIEFNFENFSSPFFQRKFNNVKGCLRNKCHYPFLLFSLLSSVSSRRLPFILLFLLSLFLFSSLPFFSNCPISSYFLLFFFSWLVSSFLSIFLTSYLRLLACLLHPFLALTYTFTDFFVFPFVCSLHIS